MMIIWEHISGPSMLHRMALSTAPYHCLKNLVLIESPKAGLLRHSNYFSVILVIPAPPVSKLASLNDCTHDCLLRYSLMSFLRMPLPLP